MRKRASSVDGWIVFSYNSLKRVLNGSTAPITHQGDGGYMASLRRQVEHVGKPLIYEDDFMPASDDSQDNYLAYGVATWLMKLADLRGVCIDTRFCGAGCSSV